MVGALGFEPRSAGASSGNWSPLGCLATPRPLRIPYFPHLYYHYPMSGVEAEISGAGYGVKAILHDVRLSAKAGEILAVVGRSGVGKTTLMLSITGVLDNLLGGWTRGRVSLAGLDPVKRDFKEVPRKIGIVLQDPDRQLAMPFVLDEVAFTLRNLGLPEKRAWGALLRFGLAHKAYAEVETLSGGEKRRLTLAASLVHEPEILILDEPSASIDPWGVGDLKRYVQTMAEKGLTILLIEHKLGFYRGVFDRILLLEAGSSTWAGSAEEADPRILEEHGVDYTLIGHPRERAFTGERVAFLRDCEFSYDGFTLRVDELDIRAGERIALIGPNGGGKTTLLKILGGFHRCSGEISVAGRAFYVPQHPDYLFVRPSVGEELRDAREKGGHEPLGLPTGIDVGSSPYKLSHGQRRWLSLAIAHAFRPRLLLLDEPTTGLDLLLVEQLTDVLWRLSKSGFSIVFSTHDPRVVMSLADRVLLVADGRVSEIDVDEAISMMLEAMDIEI